MRLTLRIRPFGEARVVTVLAVGLPVAAVLGGVIGTLYQLTSLVLSPLAAPAIVVLAFVGGFAVAVLGVRLRCRSKLLLAVLGLVHGLAADLSSWAVVLAHARHRDLHWAESGPPALSPEARDWIRGVSKTPPVGELFPERRSETVRAHTLGEYADFRWRRGWPERGYSFSGLFVALMWLLEPLLLVGIAVWVARLAASVRVRICGVHSKPLAPLVAASVPDIDHAALVSAAARESMEEILAVPRCAGSGREGRVEIHACPEGDWAAVSVRVHWKARGLDRSEVILHDAVITGDRADALRARLGGEGAAGICGT